MRHHRHGSHPLSSIVYSTFNQENLNREYSPSSCIDDIGVYLDAYASKSASARRIAADLGRSELGLSYGSAPRETMDLFVPDAKEPCPLHLFIHGGFWQQLSKNESAFAAPMFLRNGVAFAAVNYTLAPETSLTGIVDELRRALAWVYRNGTRFGVNTNRLYISGHSAGAHLCAMLLCTDWRAFDMPEDLIKGACAISGVYDLKPVRLSYVNDVMGMDEREAIGMSPMHQRIKSTCPIVLTYGDNETREFKRQTDEYRQKLILSGARPAFEEQANRNHFDVILDLGDEQTWLATQAIRQISRSDGPSAFV